MHSKINLNPFFKNLIFLIFIPFQIILPFYKPIMLLALNRLSIQMLFYFFQRSVFKLHDHQVIFAKLLLLIIYSLYEFIILGTYEWILMKALLAKLLLCKV